VHRALVVLATVGALGAWAAAGAEVRLIDDPVVGRSGLVTNGLVVAEVAPRLGGRLIRLQRADGDRLIRWTADWNQTKEGLYAPAGGAWLSGRPADAWTAEAGGVAAVRWRQKVTIAGQALTVTREIAVTSGDPTVHARVLVRNDGDATVGGLQWAITPHFSGCDGGTIGGEALDRTALIDRETDLTAQDLLLRWGEIALRPDFPDAHYQLRGEGFMFRVTHTVPLGDVAPGETVSAEGAWVIAADGERAGGAIEWPAEDAWRAVAPLRIADSPPADLPRTPGTEVGPWGVCGGMATEDYLLWRAAGIRWVRASFGWSTGEPEPGAIDLEQFEPAVASAQAHGLRLIGLIAGTPSWASTDGSRLSPPRDLGQFADYVERLARHFRGRVDVWEIWNEPDIGQFWRGSVEDYAALLTTACRAAKRGNPGCRVMSAGMDGGGERYLVTLAELGALEECDLIGFHPYAGDPRGAETRMRDLWRVLNFYGLRKPVWVTEVGWQSGGWSTGPGVVASEAIKARYLRDSYRRLSRYAEVICWYVGREPGRMYGLVRPGDGGLVLNDAYFAMREISGAGQSAAKLALSGLDEVAAKAGESTSARWTIANTGDEPIPLVAQVRDAPGWLEVQAPESLPAGASAEVVLSMEPPGYVPAREVPLVLLAGAVDGPVAVASFTVNVHNEGGSLAVRAVARWPVNATADGAQDGAWTPANQLVTAPGGFRRQPFVVCNDGTMAETFALEFTGSAAEWLVEPPAETSVAPGQEQWVSVLIAVPADVPQGSRELTMTVTSQTYPEVAATAATTIMVGQ